LRGLLRHFRVDFDPPPGPSTLRFVLAGLVALCGSLLCDVGLVAIGKFLFPITMNNSHFRPEAYVKVTAIGVVVASLGWPIVTRISSAPRWLFLRLAIVLSVVLVLLDVYLLHLGQPRRVVVVLVTMSLAMALVTYQVLVRIAPVRALRREVRPDEPRRSASGHRHGGRSHPHSWSSRSDDRRRR
jgi:hypothetical protein